MTWRKTPVGIALIVVSGLLIGQLSCSGHQREDDPPMGVVASQVTRQPTITPKSEAYEPSERWVPNSEDCAIASAYLSTAEIREIVSAAMAEDPELRSLSEESVTALFEGWNQECHAAMQSIQSTDPSTPNANQHQPLPAPALGQPPATHRLLTPSPEPTIATAEDLHRLYVDAQLALAECLADVPPEIPIYLEMSSEGRIYLKLDFYYNLAQRGEISVAEAIEHYNDELPDLIDICTVTQEEQDLFDRLRLLENEALELCDYYPRVENVPHVATEGDAIARDLQDIRRKAYGHRYGDEAVYESAIDAHKEAIPELEQRCKIPIND